MPRVSPPRPAVLVICDGWGVRDEREGNAIALARTPAYDRLVREFPYALLSASGEDVGLPAGQMGNSEVGHLNLGAGRMVPQDILRIDLSIRDGSFFRNSALRALSAGIRARGGALHLLGLLSDGGVHSHERHLFALLEFARRERLPRVFVHAFLDGRDTPPESAGTYVGRLKEEIAQGGLGAIATLSGRYYAMDRDKRWDRVRLAYDALVHGRGRRASGPDEALRMAAEAGETDEFVRPTVIERDGTPAATIRSDDGVVFFNYRADRAREMTEALTSRTFDAFERGEAAFPAYVGMTEYKEEFRLPAAFPPETLSGILAEAWEKAGRTNLRLAETEKYAHVTYFFNGGVEKEYGGESRVLVPSAKVATYDLRPEMAAPEITEKALEAVASGAHDAIVMNYANADMVGHTGKLAETIVAIECLDACLGRLADAVLARGGALLMTGDHGNAEQMIDPATGEPHTAHTTNPVPLIVASPGGRRFWLAPGGSLRDVAPTLLALQEIEAPREMTGRDLRIFSG
ncbi:MAG TPA: 2,3-bisphosphoglycerate-independent phosphoglycerate mutase [Thermoanaerobaculia bacterium]|nr:2,3-bisphosphoglycerate-independent phosphoglycerate mutase [Thermoanaerobaculia bacterium]